MKDYIFKYLDKRHTIKGNIIQLKDDNPYEHIELLFGVNNSDEILFQWVKKRVGKYYCFEFPRGSKWWYKDTQIHRDDGPARITVNGTKHWFQDGQLHRDKFPAVIYTDGTKEWWQKGRRHRDGGPAIIYSDGSKEWWLNGFFIDY